MFFRNDHIAFPVILSVNDDLAGTAVVGKHGNLDFGVRVHADIEDLTMPGEPGIRPAAVIADADGCHAIDDKEGAVHGYSFLGNANNALCASRVSSMLCGSVRYMPVL